MEDNLSAAAIMDSTASKIQQLQKAFAELESHRAIMLNLKWKELEEHFDGLQKSLKRRFNDLEDQEREFRVKIVESRDILEKRKAAVVAKEQTSLERLQEKRNAAFSAILAAAEMRERPLPLGSYPPTDEIHVEIPDPEEKVLDASDTVSKIVSARRPPEDINVQVKSYPQLVKLCQEMNSKGLHKFISDNRKDLITLREEIQIALRAASDPASLVLDSLRGFYGTDIQISDSRKDSNLLGLRRTCIMLMECLSSLFVNLNVETTPNMISENAKERAKAIADNWKPMLDYLDVEASSGNSLEAHAFLQLLATFRINTHFDQEWLSRLIPMVSHRRQTAELCRYLGLSDKMADVVDLLVKNGRQIDAVNLAFAFDLTEKFPPVPLLKSYLSDTRKLAAATKTGYTPLIASPQRDVNEKELSILKAVIKCIEDHKLHDGFPMDQLHKQILELEKGKVEKKHATEVAKPRPKRPRANGCSNASRVHNSAIDRSFYGRTAERYAPHAYAYPGPTDRHHFPLYTGTPTAYNVPPNHGNFFGGAYHYHAAYLH